MSPFDGVEEDFGGFLNAFEEGVVFGGAGCGACVRVVPEGVFAVGGFALRLRGAVAVAGEAEDGIVILALRERKVSHDTWETGQGEERAEWCGIR